MNFADVFMCGTLYGRDALGLIDFDSSIDIASKKARYYQLCREIFDSNTQIGLIEYLDSVESNDVFLFGSGYSHDLLIAAKYSRACAITYLDENKLDKTVSLSVLRHSQTHFDSYIEQVRLAQYQILSKVIMHIQCDQISDNFDLAFDLAFSEIVVNPLNNTVSIQQDLFFLGSVLHRLLMKNKQLYHVELANFDAILECGLSPLAARKVHHTYSHIIRHSPNFSVCSPSIISGLVVCNTQTSVTNFVDYTRQVKVTNMRLDMLSMNIESAIQLH